MDENTIKSLIEMGFTFEQLYNNGFLVINPDKRKPADGAEQPTDGAETPTDAKAGEPVGNNAESVKTPTEGAEQPTEGAEQPTQSSEYIKMWKAFDLFKNEIKSMLTQFNTQNSTRTSAENKTMTVDEAIIGLSKGVK